MAKLCVTCGARLSKDRAEVKDYCTAQACFTTNYRPLRLVEIGQTKTNAEIEILDDRVQRDLAEGRYRRDPIVVTRQASRTSERPEVTFKPFAAPPVDAVKARYVQSLQAQGCKVEDILGRAKRDAPRLRLTRAEVVKYMTGRRV